MFGVSTLTMSLHLENNVHDLVKRNSVKSVKIWLNQLEYLFDLTKSYPNKPFLFTQRGRLFYI